MRRAAIASSFPPLHPFLTKEIRKSVMMVENRTSLTVIEKSPWENFRTILNVDGSNDNEERGRRYEGERGRANLTELLEKRSCCASPSKTCSAS